MIGAIYARVSTDDQEDYGTSLDTQVEASLKYCESLGIEVPSYFIVKETWSGYDIDRPGLEQIRSWMRTAKIQALICHAVDRLSRNQLDMWLIYNDVDKAGIKLDFVTEQFDDTTIGRFILAARTFVAETEREKIRERTERGRRERVRQGKLPTGSRAMLGYIYNKETGKREIDTVTNPALRLAGHLVIDGKSLRETCRIVYKETGIKIPDSTLSHVLSNPAIYGKTVVYRRDARKLKKNTPKQRNRDESEWVHLPDATPSTFTLEEEQAIRAVLERNKKMRRRESFYFYPLRKFLFCKGCDVMIHITSHHRENRRAYRHKPSDCEPPRKFWSSLPLEAWVWNQIVSYFASFDSIKAAIEHLADKIKAGNGAELLDLKKQA